MTQEEILQRMLDRVRSDVDKREGSVIWDATAPAAYEIALAYGEAETKRRNTFAGTADRAGLIECCAEIGITPHPATYAVRQAVFMPADLEMTMGERFNFNDLNFYISEKIGDGVYAVTCETAGAVGNFGTGNLLPINYIRGLQSATMEETVLIYGEEEEETEVLRERYFDAINSEARDGNEAQYREWIAAFPGIGNAKILPLWNGANTVKISILDTENGVASETLVSAFQEFLDPDSKGLGNGAAPIGAIVTVSTATETPIELSGTVVLAEGYSDTDGVEEAVNAYLNSIAYAKNTVSYMSLGAVIQDCPCIEDLSNFLLNGSTQNITLGAEEIPVLSNLSLAVI